MKQILTYTLSLLYKTIWASPILVCLFAFRRISGQRIGIPKWRRAIRCNTHKKSPLGYRRSDYSRARRFFMGISASIPLAVQQALSLAVLAIFWALPSVSIIAQSLDKQVVATQGESSHTLLTWTLGEIAVEHLQATNMSIQQGLQAKAVTTIAPPPPPPPPSGVCTAISVQFVNNKITVSNLPTNQVTTLQVIRLSPTVVSLINCYNNCATPIFTLNNPGAGIYLVKIKIYSITPNGSWSLVCAKEVSLTIGANANMVQGNTEYEENVPQNEPNVTPILYPNPTSEDIVWLSMPSQAAFNDNADTFKSYTLWNILGTRILTNEIQPEDEVVPIEIAQLPDGRYYVELERIFGRPKVLPLVIARK